VHPWFVQAEGEVVEFPSRPVEAWARFDDFFEEEHERLFKALYFVTGNRQDAEELMQDAFLKLWERWSELHRISDPVGYLFRVALNGFRMRRRRAAMAIRRCSRSRSGVTSSSTRRCAQTCGASSSRSPHASGPLSCSRTSSAIRPRRRRASCASVHRR
jgi:hypothetical protein